jgi:hypothetical protein
VIIRACYPDSVYLARNHSIKTTVLLYTREGKVNQEALLDSGVTENLIHPWLVQKIKLPMKKLAKTWRLFNVDKSTNKIGGITHIVVMAIQSGKHLENHQFLIADIGEENIILGYPFFEGANPDIDWPTGTLAQKVILFNHNKWMPHMSDLEADWVHANTRKTTIAQQLAKKTVDKKEHTWQELVPKKYHKHGQVFSKQASEQFPRKRLWNHTINLKPNAPTSIDCQIYPLSP